MKIEDYDTFKEKLKKVVRSVFTDTAELYSRENLMGFALVADRDGRMLSVTVNTWNHLRESSKRSAGNELYYKFTPGELAEEFYLLSQMDDLNNFLDRRSSPLYGDKIFAVIVDTLEELRSEGLFEGMDNNFVLEFTINDFFDRDVLLGWFERLNGAGLVQEYRAFLVRSS
ncbi:MAG: DUF4303 domain-containing protein [Bacteroides sp.]|nr:DUF4303 domain-containing protein [Bacteroides sp.]